MRIIEENLSYIDFRVLAILLALMIIVAGIRKTGFFDKAVEKLLEVVNTTRGLVVSLVLACFFVSMLMTNDVALITFVPFAIMVIEKADKKDLLIKCIVLQTVAANLGSMLTPIGNPQNLYLYSKAQMTLFEFFRITYLYALISLVLLLVCCIFMVKNEKVFLQQTQEKENVDIKRLLIYVVLFCVAIASVLHVLDYRVMLVCVLLVVAVLDYKLIGKADYKLLLTFVVLFLIIGNVKNISVINDFISRNVRGNEILWSIVLSQLISNVPAAMLLSGFTTAYSTLIIGTNIGGLGTLIASMASLISYKEYGKLSYSNRKKYMIEFTATNIAFLVVLVVVVFVFN